MYRLYSVVGSSGFTCRPSPNILGRLKRLASSRSPSTAPTGTVNATSITEEKTDAKDTKVETCPRPPTIVELKSGPSFPGDGGDAERRTQIYQVLTVLAGIGSAALLYKFFWRSTDATETTTRKPKGKPKKKPHDIPKIPINPQDIPKDIPYLLIGGGTASFAAFRAIKSSDPRARVLVISNEPFYPYMRPPLSKELFYDDERAIAKNLEFKQWNGTERSLFYEPEDFYTTCDKLLTEENGGVAVARGWSVKGIDVQNKVVTLESGDTIKYGKCLLATGAKPNSLDVLNTNNKALLKKVSVYRSIYDFLDLEEMIESGAKSIAIIGGGFLGSELACSLARRGKKDDVKVFQIFREDGIMAKVLPVYLRRWTTEKMKKEGVNIMGSVSVKDVSLQGDQVKLSLSNGETLLVDHLVTAVGVTPNTDLAEGAGLEVDSKHGGYLANAELQVRTDLYVAGDNTCFYDTKYGRRMVNHHDHAVVSGRLAGENMVGAAKPYSHQSMYWSDLGPEIGYEAIGIVDAELPTVGVYAKKSPTDEASAQEAKAEGDLVAEMVKPVPAKVLSPNDVDQDEYQKGVVFYLKNNKVVGIVLWNIFNRMQIARQVLKLDHGYEDLNEVAKLFKIHSP